jgi:hypothetical protein
VKEGVWRGKLIANYESPLKKGSNYELTYEVVEDDYHHLLRYAIGESRNDLVKYLWSGYKNDYSACSIYQRIVPVISLVLPG